MALGYSWRNDAATMPTPTIAPQYRVTNLKLYREQQSPKLSQEKLAELVDTTGATISRLESGHQPYGQELLEKIADVLNRDPGDLITKYAPEAVELTRLLHSLGREKLALAIRIIEGIAGDDDSEGGPQIRNAALSARRHRKK